MRISQFDLYPLKWMNVFDSQYAKYNINRGEFDSFRIEGDFLLILTKDNKEYYCRNIEDIHISSILSLGLGDCPLSFKSPQKTKNGWTIKQSIEAEIYRKEKKQNELFNAMLDIEQDINSLHNQNNTSNYSVQNMLTKHLLTLLPEDQKEHIFAYPYCDISDDFIGFIDTYYYLSKMIPKHWTVIDFGCGYNAQCFFFTEHTRYIAVDFPGHPRFCASNTELVDSPIQEYLEQWQGNVDTVFAISNYVTTTSTRQLISAIFPNCYCFYPAN